MCGGFCEGNVMCVWGGGFCEGMEPQCVNTDSQWLNAQLRCLHALQLCICEVTPNSYTFLITRTHKPFFLECIKILLVSISHIYLPLPFPALHQWTSPCADPQLGIHCPGLPPPHLGQVHPRVGRYTQTHLDLQQQKPISCRVVITI